MASGSARQGDPLAGGGSLHLQGVQASLPALPAPPNVKLTCRGGGRGQAGTARRKDSQKPRPGLKSSPVDRVLAPPPPARDRHVAVGDQLGHDPLDGPLGDPDLVGHVPHPGGRVGGQADEDVGMVGQEAPRRAGRPGLGRLGHDSSPGGSGPSPG
jgi:hypothetical protein